MALTNALLRMAPLPIGELPDHQLFREGESTDGERPDPINFLIALLNAGDEFVKEENFNRDFKSIARKSVSPAASPVEALTYSIPQSDIEKVNWAETGVAGFARSKPRRIQAEHWFARRSVHANVSAKQDGSTANWDEFVYGLRDEHAKHEYDFTATLYDAHLVMDWNDVIAADLASETSKLKQTPYTNLTFSVYENCHAIPWPLNPRCFQILVATASTSSDRFIAVTIPVNLGNFKAAMYASGRHKMEGDDKQLKKDVVFGEYAAVEEVKLHRVAAAAGNEKEEIVWTMATASDAKGNLPMAIQKASMPGAVVKDVSFFLNWIKTVSEEEIKTQQPGTHSAR